MVESLVLPDPADRLDARLSAVGATKQQIDVAGSRSVEYSDPGTLGGKDAAQAIRDAGFKGCWIFALAINDAGFVSSGDGTDTERIDTMMDIADGEPVMWVNGSMLDSGPLGYLKPDVLDWNAALVDACQTYPALRVYDWASEVNPDWYTDDGIHYSPIGYGERARLIADGLVAAFPGDQPLPSGQGSGDPDTCLVTSGAGVTPVTPGT
jgi:hypothetical protein